ncbi:hypothetical protein LTR66_009602 [Elasticomyces elasticus]|nr:hypothetical protein LTR66_009602 [Elasticomyces elasticus]
MKRAPQRQSFDAADKDAGSPTGFSRFEIPTRTYAVGWVEPPQTSTVWRSGLGTTPKSRKPQGALPSAETDKGQGGEKAVVDMKDYIRTLEDHKEKIAPIQVFYNDDGRVVGMWRGNLQIGLPEYRFMTFYGIDRVPSIGSLAPSMRRSHPERFSGTGQCKPSQADEQSSQVTTMHSTTAPKAVASEDKAEMEGASISGNTAMGRLGAAERH